MSSITVTTTADQGNGSLRDAIAHANTGDTIQFDQALAGQTIALTSGQLLLNKDLTLDGSGAAGLTISGNHASRVFMLDQKRSATLKNLTIANGKTTEAGGGIDTGHESTLVLENVNVNNNVSELGGGLRVGHLAKATILNSSFNGNDGTLTDKYSGFSAGAISQNESRGQLIIQGSRFENNVGSIGGAIYSFSSVTFNVEDSVFLNNVAENGSGGAIFTDGVSSSGYDSGLADDGKIIIRGSRFENNQAQKEGGALFLWGYTPEGGYKADQAIIEDTVISGNVVAPDASGQSKGGGLWAKMGLDIRNVTFANNTATQQGGGLWVESSLPASIVNSTFSGNRALSDAGGAMFLNNGAAPVDITHSTIAYNSAGRANGGLWFSGEHNVTLKNSIVAFNTASDHRQDQVGYQPKDGGGNLEFSTSSEAMRVFESGLVADPLLGELADVNGALIHPLQLGSPAVNAGVVVQTNTAMDTGAIDLGTLSPSPTVGQPLASPSFSPLEDSVSPSENSVKDQPPHIYSAPLILKTDRDNTDGEKQWKGDLLLDGGHQANQDGFYKYLPYEQPNEQSEQLLITDADSLYRAYAMIGQLSGGCHSGLMPAADSGLTGTGNERGLFNDALIGSEIAAFL
jgi:predicted outer membrane repeat protein